MEAFRLHRTVSLSECEEPLRLDEVPVPVPGPGELLVKVAACGVCHTELDEIEGRTPPPRLPVTPGHQLVGRVAATGGGPTRFRAGDRVGGAWIHSACGECDLCRSGRENLCPGFSATGRDADGGYAEYAVLKDRFAAAIPALYGDAEAAPLLCAGAVGYRSLRLAGLADGDTLGLMGFGSSAHLVLQLARRQYPASQVFVFARSPEERAFAASLGAAWTGDTGERPPRAPRAIIDTTPVWTPVLASLEHLAPGGRLVVNAIRKEDADRAALLGLDYARHLWMEKQLCSVANVTTRDVEEFLSLAAAVPIRPEVQPYPFREANRALLDLRRRHVRGAKVLVMA